MNVAEPTKVCNRCGERKPWSAYYAKVKWPDGTMRQPHSRCGKCMRELSVEWQRRNPEKKRALAKRHRANITADPERLAERQARQRDWQRERNGTPAERFREPGHAARTDVPVTDVLRAAVRAVGVCEVARRIARDEKHVRRILGREAVGAAIAVALCEAVGLIPAEAGL